MKRSAILIALVLFLALGCLVSCEELESNRLIGTWESGIVEEELTIDMGFGPIQIPIYSKYTITISDSEKLVVDWIAGSDPENLDNSAKLNGTYSAKSSTEGTMTVDFTPTGLAGEVTGTYVLKGDTLTISFNWTEDFTRKK